MALFSMQARDIHCCRMRLSPSMMMRRWATHCAKRSALQPRSPQACGRKTLWKTPGRSSLLASASSWQSQSLAHAGQPVAGLYSPRYSGLSCGTWGQRLHGNCRTVDELAE